MTTENNAPSKKPKKKVIVKVLAPVGWDVFDSDTLLNMEIPEQDFLVKYLLPAGGITMLSGNPGSGKSWIMLQIAKCVGSGDQLFTESLVTPESLNRFRTKESRVLYIDEESHLSEIQRRWKMLNPPMFSLVHFMSMQVFKIDEQDKRQGLLDFIDYHGYKLIIFDSLNDLHSKNENDAQQAQMVIDYFKEITKKGVTVLIAHHNRKESYTSPNSPSQRLRGSTAITAGLDCLISVDKSKSIKDVLEITISQPKLRQGKAMHAFKVNLIEKDKFMLVEYAGELEEKENKLQQAKDKIVEILDDGEKRNSDIIAILKKIPVGDRTAKDALKELIQEDKIKSRKESRYVYYFINEESEAEEVDNAYVSL